MLRQVEIAGDLADRAVRGGRLAASDRLRKEGGLVGGTVAAHQRATPSSGLILPFNTCEGRNTRTRRGRMGTSAPVFGLRPMRCPIWARPKLQRAECFTCPPPPRARHT